VDKRSRKEISVGESEGTSGMTGMQGLTLVCRLGTMKSTESDVCYFEVDAVFNQELVELLEESTWTAGLRTGNKTGEDVLCFLEFGDVFLSSSE